MASRSRLVNIRLSGRYDDCEAMLQEIVAKYPTATIFKPYLNGPGTTVRLYLSVHIVTIKARKRS